ncbi:hypothetical protein G6F45_013897 [Rhizopus arrhizus]|nr:hypothetical protein G6F45_013897 [Rhizopus arrhizus]
MPQSARYSPLIPAMADICRLCRRRSCGSVTSSVLKRSVYGVSAADSRRPWPLYRDMPSEPGLAKKRWPGQEIAGTTSGLSW